MFDAIATVLAWLFSLTNGVGNNAGYALAIALLTLIVMLLVTPLTLKGTRSMLQLQRYQPELRRIQQEYKGDRQKLNEELMKFYQEHKINPLGGCLPLLLQAPVFLVLYRVLHELTRECTPALLSGGQCTTVGNFAPAYLDPSSQLYQFLTGVKSVPFLGMDLAARAIDELRSNFVGAIPYLVLIAVVAVTAYVQQWQISARNTGSGNPVNPQQQMLLRILPLFTSIFSLVIPAGLIMYFFVSNTYRVVQNEYITRTMYRKQPPPLQFGKDGDAASKAAPPEAKGRSGGAATGERPKPKPAPRAGSSGGRVTPPKRATSGGPNAGAKADKKPGAKPGAKPTPQPRSPKKP
jgi:YidC/Oxa1 family membrane protein insertase